MSFGVFQDYYSSHRAVTGNLGSTGIIGTTLTVRQETRSICLDLLANLESGLTLSFDATSLRAAHELSSPSNA